MAGPAYPEEMQGTSFTISQEDVLEQLKCLTSENVFNSSLSPGNLTNEEVENEMGTNATILKSEITVLKKNASCNSSEDTNKQNSPLNSETCKYTIKFKRIGDKTIKIWECGICGREFQHQYTLMRHFPIHTGERKFKCEDCGKAFRQKSTLSQHQVIHSEARPYVCALCKKTFNRASTLKSHHVTHSEQKPHKCPVCGKGFHQKGNLRNHIFIHTEERPYKCNTCGKGFNQMSNLISHKQHTHRNANLYVCSYCHKEFPRKYVLRAHEEYIHGINYKGDIYLDKMRNNAENDLKSSAAEYSPESSIATKNNFTTCEHKPTITDIKCENENKLSILINPVNTQAMLSAKREGRTSIALLKTSFEESVLVKVVDTLDMKQMLVPASANDLKSAGAITTVKSVNMENNRSGITNAIQIKVPIVATIVQKSTADGQALIEVENPHFDQESNCNPKHILQKKDNKYSASLFISQYDLQTTQSPSANSQVSYSADSKYQENVE
ncbi:hypothetical protein R5R35_013019 [Gryllus longicercus]|uniref:C2H2-type domain-containing protein n=1 Tax=Gryllus longicercus TaxID=2509291 RepID=A0AAN9VM34_9ORTH